MKSLLCFIVISLFIVSVVSQSWINSQSQFSAFSRPFRWGHACGSTTGAHLACYSGIGADGGATVTLNAFDYLSNGKILTLPPPSFTGPISRVLATSVVSQDRYLVIYGGYKGDAVVPHPRLLIYDFETSNITVRNDTLQVAAGTQSFSDHYTFGAYGPSSVVAANGDVFIYGGNAVIINLDFVTRLVPSTSTFVPIVPNSAGIAAPTPRYGSSVGLYQNTLWVYGGARGQGSPGSVTPTYVSDMGKFDLASSSWQDPGSAANGAPSARALSAYVPLSDNRLIIFGGRGSTGVLNDLHAFNMASGAWVTFSATGTAPSARDRMGFFHLNWAGEDSVLIFGGADGNAGPLDDFWYLRITSSGTSPIQAPPDVVVTSPTSSLYVLPSLSGSTPPAGQTPSPSPVPPKILDDESAATPIYSWMTVIM